MAQSRVQLRDLIDPVLWRHTGTAHQEHIVHWYRDGWKLNVWLFCTRWRGYELRTWLEPKHPVRVDITHQCFTDHDEVRQAILDLVTDPIASRVLMEL